MLRNAFYLSLLLLVLFTGCSQTSHKQLADLPSMNVRKFRKLAESQEYDRAGSGKRFKMVSDLYRGKEHIALYNIATKGSEYERNSVSELFTHLKEYDFRWYIDLLHSENRSVRSSAQQILQARADTSITQYLIPMLENENSGVVSSAASLLAYYMDEKAIPLLIQQRNKIDDDVLKHYGEPAADQIVTALDRGEAFSPLLLSDFIFNPTIEQALSNFVSDSTTDQEELKKLGRFMVEKGDSLSIKFLAKHADRGNGELYTQLYQYEHLFDSIPYPIPDSLLFTFTNSRVKTSIAKFLPEGDYSPYWSELRECYSDKGSYGAKEFANFVISKDTSGRMIDSIINDFNNYQISPLGAIKALEKVNSPQKYRFAEQFIGHSSWEVNNEMTRLVAKDSSAGALLLNKKRLAYSLKQKDKKLLNQVIHSLRSVKTPEAAELLIDFLGNKSYRETFYKLADNDFYEVLAASGNPRAVPYLIRGFESLRDASDLYGIFRSMKVIDDERLVEPLLNVIRKAIDKKYYASYHGFYSEILEKAPQLLVSIHSEKAKLAYLEIALHHSRYSWYVHENAIPLLKRNYSAKNRITVVNWFFENREHKKIFEAGLELLPTVVGKSKQFALIDRLNRIDSTTPEQIARYLSNCDYRNSEDKLFEMMPYFDSRHFYSNLIAKPFHNGLCDGFALIKEIKEQKISDYEYYAIFSPNRHDVKQIASEQTYQDLIKRLDSAGMIQYNNSNDELTEEILEYIEKYPESYPSIIDKYLAAGKWKKSRRKSTIFQPDSHDDVWLPENPKFLSSYESEKFYEACKILHSKSSSSWVEQAFLFYYYLNDRYRKYLDDYIVKCGDSIKDQLLAASRSENWKLRERSLYYLSRIDESECRERMKELTDDPVYAVRMKSRFYLR